MALQLNKLAAQVDQMGRVLAARQARHEDLVTKARARLAAHGQYTDELRARVDLARRTDTSWRGAQPLDRLDARCLPNCPARHVVLIAVDGSQIYPDRHGIATYYLINTGSIVLRQGSGAAPTVDSQATVYFDDGDLYDDAYRLRDVEYINQKRQRAEMARSVELALAERAALGGDVEPPILSLSDGPLLPWTPGRAPEGEMRRAAEETAADWARMRAARAVPVGYIDRPGSAYILRTVELADLTDGEVTREKVRRGPFRQLTDRLLFYDLAPNERTGLFASTSEMNEQFGRAGHRVLFFYANMAQPGRRPIIARVELPEWASDPQLVDCIQHALYADCALTRFPYVLARAHELAVVGTGERAEFDGMIERALLRQGMHPASSMKAEQKRLTGGRH